MRFNVEKHRKLVNKIISLNQPAAAGGVEVLCEYVIEACDEIDFHKQRRTFHDTLTLMQHEHSVVCLEAYRKAFSDLVEYTNECADFRNGVTDPSGGTDEGTIRAANFISDLRHKLFMTETHRVTPAKITQPIIKTLGKPCYNCRGQGNVLGDCAQDPVETCDVCNGRGTVDDWG